MIDMQKISRGFTLIELMIVVAIVGILAAISIPLYRDYTTRTRVTEGIHMAAAAKIAVAEFAFQNNSFPSSNAAAGISNNYSTTYISTITVSGSGLVSIAYTAASGVTAGDVIQFVPTLTAAGSIDWSCNGAGTTMNDRYLPAECR